MAVVSMDNCQPGNTYKGVEHRYIPDFCQELVQGYVKNFRL